MRMSIEEERSHENKKFIIHSVHSRNIKETKKEIDQIIKRNRNRPDNKRRGSGEIDIRRRL